MTNRRNSTTGAANDTGATQDNMNQLYAAHQVHTLAQIVYRHLAGGWQGQAGWTPQGNALPQGSGWQGQPAWTPQGSSFPQPGVGASPSSVGAAPRGGAAFPPMPPAVFYWYP